MLIYNYIECILNHKIKLIQLLIKKLENKLNLLLNSKNLSIKKLKFKVDLSNNKNLSLLIYIIKLVNMPMTIKKIYKQLNSCLNNV
jgi:hypothetical protein